MSSSAALPPNQNNHAGGAGGGEGCAASSGGSGAAHQQPLTFWCHECDMSVTLLPSSSPAPLLCPQCSGDFLEEMELPPSPPPHRSNTLTLSLSDSDSDMPDLDLLADSLDDPRRRRRVPAQAYLRRLIHHLAAGDDHPLPIPIAVRGHSPAPKSSIDALPTVQMTCPFPSLRVPRTPGPSAPYKASVARPRLSRSRRESGRRAQTRRDSREGAGGISSCLGFARGGGDGSIEVGDLARPLYHRYGILDA